MAASPPPPPSFCYLTMPSLKRNRLSLQVRAQSFRDHEGRSSNFVDANLRVLRERIEEVRIKERLERCCRIEHGWNYASGYDNYKNKRSAELLHIYEIFILASGTFGLTIVSGTLCLCLASLLVHMSQ